MLPVNSSENALLTSTLSPSEEMFCYEFFYNFPSNGRAAYLKAFPCPVDMEVGDFNQMAPILVGKLLRRPDIQARLREFLTATGYTAERIDQKLLEHMESNNWKQSLEAIKEMNKVLNRITNKSQVTVVNANDLLDRIIEANASEVNGSE